MTVKEFLKQNAVTISVWQCPSPHGGQLFHARVIGAVATTNNETSFQPLGHGDTANKALSSLVNLIAGSTLIFAQPERFIAVPQGLIPGDTQLR